MVRDPDQPTARELADQGVEVVAGSLSDRGSLAAAMSGGSGVRPFSKPSFSEDRSVEQLEPRRVGGRTTVATPPSLEPEGGTAGACTALTIWLCT
ncbi:NmrA family NAD(P)-binding protein [Streptomyces lydicus]|uniref:NmrA family NAD(P)-binding protein n=1 Tax=Streptomyces lydicus TaxID=47763 RepID=UPI003794EB25